MVDFNVSFVQQTLNERTNDLLVINQMNFSFKRTSILNMSLRQKVDNDNIRMRVRAHTRERKGISGYLKEIVHQWRYLLTN